MFKVTVLPEGRLLEARGGEKLLEVLRGSVSAPCGGQGKCGKCRVAVDGEEKLACAVTVDRDMTVTLPEIFDQKILTQSPEISAPGAEGHVLAMDIGTTTLVCSLLEGSGRELAVAACPNPQAAYGADVVTRIREALEERMEELTRLVRNALEELGLRCCREAGIQPQQVNIVSPVGNTCMRQLFLGLSPENLGKLPYSRAVTEPKRMPCAGFFPAFSEAELVVLPDIGPFVGTDTLGCILSSRIYEKEALTLLVDIGTNGELVLGNRERLVCCATAAGPALEGAGIRFGMTAAEGAIDRVWAEDGVLRCHVIGEGPARGICGSGIIDAAAACLSLGLLDRRGRILNDEKKIFLTEEIFLTQEDIRQVQLAKGAICAGVKILAEKLGAGLSDIRQVLLAGGFGSFLNPDSACRMGLLPEKLQGRITAIGNAALGGAKLLGLDESLMSPAAGLAEKTEYLELGSEGAFSGAFARAMGFREDWEAAARNLGFTTAAPLDPKGLTAREDVRAMCAQDKCGAYGRNWTCPPYCGTLEQCQARMRSFREGLLLQTVGHMKKDIDSRAYRETERRHMENFRRLADRLRRAKPGALCLGAGSCRVCKKCAWPEPCRFPEQALSSMEGYGLFVTQVCRDAGVPYHHGEKTITYTACVLY